MQRKQDFIGLHFFSPVDKMPLLEIIRGEQTSDEALARALDYAAQIKKTPIVVNDSRGFFTSRVIGTFVNEALAMLGEGVAPATIEQATTQAGYPVGALQLADELNLELFLKIRNETREAAGDSVRARTRPRTSSRRWSSSAGPGRLRGRGLLRLRRVGQAHRAVAGAGRALPGAGRPGRRSTCTSSRSGCSSSRPSSRRAASRRACIVTTADANIGSIMGIGFPPWTGGVLQYINGYPGGVAAFVARAEEFAGEVRRSASSRTRCCARRPRTARRF